MNKKMLLVAVIASTILSGCGGSDGGADKAVDKALANTDTAVSGQTKDQINSLVDEANSNSIPTSSNSTQATSIEKHKSDSNKKITQAHKTQPSTVMPISMPVFTKKTEQQSILHFNKDQFDTMTENGHIHLINLGGVAFIMKDYQLRPDMMCGEEYTSDVYLRGLMKDFNDAYQIEDNKSAGNSVNAKYVGADKLAGKYRVTSVITKRKDETDNYVGSWVCKVTVFEGMPEPTLKSDLYFDNGVPVEIAIASFDNTSGTYISILDFVK